MGRTITTIAYKDGIIAADTQTTFGNIRATSDPKIKVLPNGLLIAIAGDVAKGLIAERFFSQPDWITKLDDSPTFKRGFEALLFPNGRPHWCANNCVPVPLVNPFYSMGSGWQIAMAGMKTGLNAVQAVQLAGELDIYTNNTVQVVHVKDFYPQQKEKQKRTRRAA